MRALDIIRNNMKHKPPDDIIIIAMVPTNNITRIKVVVDMPELGHLHDPTIEFGGSHEDSKMWYDYLKGILPKEKGIPGKFTPKEVIDIIDTLKSMSFL